MSTEIKSDWKTEGCANEIRDMIDTGWWGPGGILDVTSEFEHDPRVRESGQSVNVTKQTRRERRPFAFENDAFAILHTRYHRPRTSNPNRFTSAPPLHPSCSTELSDCGYEL